MEIAYDKSLADRYPPVTVLFSIGEASFQIALCILLAEEQCHIPAFNLAPSFTGRSGMSFSQQTLNNEQSALCRAFARAVCRDNWRFLHTTIRCALCAQKHALTKTGIKIFLLSKIFIVIVVSVPVQQKIREITKKIVVLLWFFGIVMVIRTFIVFWTPLLYPTNHFALQF